MKRKRTSNPTASNGDITPTKPPSSRRVKISDPTPPIVEQGTPSRGKSQADDTIDTAPPSISRSRLAVTPSPQKKSFRFADSVISPPPLVTNADRSARRKSVRRMVARAANGDISDEDDEEDAMGRRIYEGSDESESEEDHEEAEITDRTASPSKRGRPRGRAKKVKEPPPPPSTDGPEFYFHQNRKTRQITSNSTLAGLTPLDHATYFRILREHEEDHEEDKEHLEGLHKGNFHQWEFELSQGFNILLYGYGSKRKLLMFFAKQLYSGPGSIVVVNGYVPTLTIKDVMSTIATSLLGANHGLRLGTNPNEMLENILSILDSEKSTPFTLVLHSLDGEALRQERSQAILAHLAAHDKVSVVASIDHIKAPLLWDAAKISQFNFLWHDATTFAPYSIESSLDDSLGLIGGSGRAGGIKGVKYVLASLPSNAKSLFRVLISHQLQAMIDDPAGGTRGSEEFGVEFRTLYQKAVEEFICTNDMAFRTLLKEFHDHQMVTSRKDVQGTEVLWAPFKREELETILEEIVM
ncbi:Origin recognition complex subunit 2 [Rhizina undulata]